MNRLIKFFFYPLYAAGEDRVDERSDVGVSRRSAVRLEMSTQLENYFIVVPL
jgi:hypothetical protein